MSKEKSAVELYQEAIAEYEAVLRAYRWAIPLVWILGFCLLGLMISLWYNT